MEDARVVIPGKLRPLVVDILAELIERNRQEVTTGGLGVSIQGEVLVHIMSQIANAPTEPPEQKAIARRGPVRSGPDFSKNLRIRLFASEVGHLRRLLGTEDIREVRMWAEISSAWDKAKRLPDPKSDDQEELEED